MKAFRRLSHPQVKKTATCTILVSSTAVNVTRRNAETIYLRQFRRSSCGSPTSLRRISRCTSSRHHQPINSTTRTMTTHQLTEFDPPLTIIIKDKDLSLAELRAYPAFQTWLNTLYHSLSLQRTRSDHAFHSDPYMLKEVRINYVTRFGENRIGFITLYAQVQNNAGEKLPGACMLRGGSVGMLVMLQPDDVPAGDGRDKHVILTVQPRIAAGSLAFTELPAGMLDDAGSFAGGAAKEIKEEVGLDIAADELLDMTALAAQSANDAAFTSNASDSEGEALQYGVYTSPGGQDEFIPLFLYEKRVPRTDLSTWAGRLTGLRDHGEKITLKLCRLEDLWRVAGRDAKALSALALYNALKQNGKL